MAEWHEMFVAAAGAAAALAGLVFVAVSINVERILSFHGLPERALQTILLLLAAVVVSLVSLIPQSIEALAVELLVVGIGTVRRRVHRHPGRLRHRRQPALADLASGRASARKPPYLVAGVSLWPAPEADSPG